MSFDNLKAPSSLGSDQIPPAPPLPEKLISIIGVDEAEAYRASLDEWMRKITERKRGQS